MVTEYLIAGINVRLLLVLPNTKDAPYLILIKMAYLMIKTNVLICPGIQSLMVVHIQTATKMVLQIIRTAVRTNLVQPGMMAVQLQIVMVTVFLMPLIVVLIRRVLDQTMDVRMMSKRNLHISLKTFISIPIKQRSRKYLTNLWINLQIYWLNILMPNLQ